MQTIIAYKNVFDRTSPAEFTFDDYLNNPKKIFDNWELDIETTKIISQIQNKEIRNQQKRENLPAIDISRSGILAIDIDNISDDAVKYNDIVERCKKLDNIYVLKQSVSGNLVAFFKYECTVQDYPFLYYKIYLEMTLLLAINIDFLPEIGRLRYVGQAGYIIKNDDAKVITSILKVDRLPIINTSISTRKARGIVYGSK